jgi:hypothetical protein
MRKCGKKFLKCSIFNGFLHSANFPHPFRKFSANSPFVIKDVIIKPTQRINSLIFNALQTSLKRLIFNGFAVVGGRVKGRVLSKG